MMTVNEVSRLTGVSIRALHYYDQIGLLKPSRVAESGYRYYSGAKFQMRTSMTMQRWNVCSKSCCSGNWNFR